MAYRKGVRTKAEDVMRQFPVLLAVGLIVGAGSIGCDKPAKDVSLFQADLSGAGENPPRATGAIGNRRALRRRKYGQLHDRSPRHHLDHRGRTSIPGPRGPTEASGSALFPAPGTNFLPTGTSTGAIDGILIQGSFNSSQVTGVTYDELRERDACGNGLCQRPHHPVPRRGDPGPGPTRPLTVASALARLLGR